MTNIAVIGANYGDEGKGRMVDYYVKQALHKNQLPLVIRFSGSNNAAHTVVGEEETCVFNLLGSGTLRGAPTYLYKNVCVDIRALLAEYKSHNKWTDLFVDPRCRLVLPYDVMLCRIKETVRGKNKHGSTGNGLNECIDRNEFIPLTTGSFQIHGFSTISEARKLFAEKIAQYDFSSMDQQDIMFIEYLASKDSCQIVYDRINDALDEITVGIPDIRTYSCIFEGSQGLLLDEYGGNYPHVTRSRTGSHNLIDFCREFNVSIDRVCYVSRPYLSRHGADAGFIEDTNFKDSFHVVDLTNVPNPWQDHMKYKFIDMGEMLDRISDDFKVINRQCKYAEMMLAMTCMDQINDGNQDMYRDAIHARNIEYIAFESPANDKEPT